MLVKNRQTQSLHIPLLGLGSERLGKIVIERERTLYNLGLSVFWRGMQAAWIVSALVLLLGHLILGRLGAAQRERRRLERRYRAVVEQAIEGMALVDSKRFMVLEANQSLGRMLGCAPEDLVGKSVLDYVALEANQLIRQLQAVVGCSPSSGEYRLRKQDGTLLEVEGSISAVVEDHDCFDAAHLA